MKSFFGILVVTLMMATTAYSHIFCARCADRIFLFNRRSLPFLKFDDHEPCTKNAPVTICEDECVVWDWVDDNGVVARLRHCSTNLFNDTAKLEEFRSGLYDGKRPVVVGFKNLQNSVILCHTTHCNFRSAAELDYADWGLEHYHYHRNQFFDVISKANFGFITAATVLVPVIIVVVN